MLVFAADEIVRLGFDGKFYVSKGSTSREILQVEPFNIVCIKMLILAKVWPNAKKMQLLLNAMEGIITKIKPP